MSVQPTSAPFADGEDKNELRRVLGAPHLVALGVGGVIGAGIFVITGQAAAMYAGPGIMISFAIAGFGCLLAGLCYAEFAAMIPITGSAYTYARASLGQFMAWIIGWDLVLEYLVAAATVSVGWSGYFASMMSDFGMPLPPALINAPLMVTEGNTIEFTGAILNVPAVVLIALLTIFLVLGIRASSWFNNLMVLVKLTVLLLVIGFGMSYIEMDNLDPIIPPNTGTFGEFGWSGILRASGVIFFAYIGFDAVSIAAQEARNPQRDMPIGILGSLAICTVLYMLMSFVITGMAPYETLAVPQPVYVAVEQAGENLAWLLPIISVGATVGLASVVLVLLLGQSRIFYAMSRDGMLPPLFSRIHPRFRTPYLGTIITGICAAVLGGILPLSVLGELVSIGTLAAFIVVCISVIVLRASAPHAHRPFRTPFVPWVPLGGIAVCGTMMAWLPPDTWIRLLVWLFIGLVIYAVYGVRHAKPPAWTIDKNPAE